MYPSSENPGYGVFVKNVSDGLEKFGIHTKCISAISGRGKYFLGKFFKYFIFYCSIFFNYFKKYDCIYVHFPTYSSPILYLLMHICPKKLVVNFHGEDLLYQTESKFQQFLGKISDRLTKKYSTFVVVPSSYFKKIVLDRGLAFDKNVVVSPSGGINDNLFYLRNPKTFNNKNDLHLGFIGRLEESKGIREFIEAVLVLNKLFSVRATIIGYGPLSEEVSDWVKDYDFFELINGLPQTQLPIYYNKFDLFCFPSKRLSESLGLVGIESMACGTPVIGSNIGGISSYLINKSNGFLISLDNLTGGIVESVKSYLNLDEKIKQQMINNGLETSKMYARGIVCQKLSVCFLNYI